LKVSNQRVFPFFVQKSLAIHPKCLHARKDDDDDSRDKHTTTSHLPSRKCVVHENDFPSAIKMWASVSQVSLIEGSLLFYLLPFNGNFQEDVVSAMMIWANCGQPNNNKHN